MQVEQAGLNQAKARLIAEHVDLIVGVLKVSKGTGWQAAIQLVSLERTQQPLLLFSHFCKSAVIISSAAYHVSSFLYAAMT
jgi:hypothetical protein